MPEGPPNALFGRLGFPAWALRPSAPPKAEVLWRRDVVGPVVASAREALAGVCAAPPSAGSATAASSFDAFFETFDRGLDEISSVRGVTSDVAQFAWLLAALERTGPMASRVDRARQAFRDATRILFRHGIGASGSRLSELHTALHRALAAIHNASGKDWEAQWLLAEIDEATPAIASEILARGADAVRLKLLERELGAEADDLARLRAARVRVLELSGRFDEAIEALEELVRGGGDSDRCAWGRARITAMRSGDLTVAFRALRDGVCARTPARLLLLAIWSRATQSKQWMKDVPSVGTIARSCGPDLAAEVRAAKALEGAYRSELALAARVHRVKQALTAIDDLDDPLARLLVLGASCRWLARAKQGASARLPGARYRAESFSLSSGATDDLCALRLVDSGEAPTELDAPLLRPLSAARLAISLSWAGAKSWLEGGSVDERLAEYGAILESHASVLKGPLMKVGQLLAFYGFDLPEEARAVLSRLHDDAPALAFPTVRSVVEQSLGQRMDDVFARFSTVPFAAGSVGQVHAAVLPDGSHVAVKVRYPNLAETVEHDLRAARLLLPFLRSAMPGWDWEGHFAELRARILEECDFSIEARNQQAFCRRFFGFAGIHVPHVHAALSSPSLLVTERFRGMPFAEFVATARNDERNRAARSVLRYSIVTTLFDGAFNTDLQPGNLLFGGDQVCFVDFGSIRRWTNEEGAGFRTIVDAVLIGDRSMLRRGLEQVQMLTPGANVDMGALYDWFESHLLRILAVDEPVRIDKQLLMREVRAFAPKGEGARFGLRVAPVYLYGFRHYWGLFGTLSDLNVALNWRRAALEILRDHAQPVSGLPRS